MIRDAMLVLTVLVASAVVSVSCIIVVAVGLFNVVAWLAS